MGGLQAAFDGYLEEKGLDWEALFSQADLDENGVLDSDELSDLIREVLQSSTRRERGFWQTMIKEPGAEGIGLKDLRQGIADAKQMPSDVDIRDILDRLKAAVNSSAASLRSLFNMIDKGSSGALDFQEVFLLLKQLMPSLSTRETRQALRHIYEIDSDGDDKISCEDLQQALGISDAAQGPLQASFEADSDVLLQTTTAEEDMPDAMMRSVTFGEQNQAESDTRTMSGDPNSYNWSLHEFSLDIEQLPPQKFLIDPRTKLVYRPSSDRNSPTPVGLVAGRSVLLSIGARDLFRELDLHLKTKGVKLRRLFNDYDDDKNEKLDSKELSSLLSEVVPTSSPAEHAFFESMVDVEGRGAVTFDTFSKSIAECRSLSSLQSSRCQEAVQKATSHLRRMISEQGISLHELFEEIAGIVQQRVLPFRKLIDLVNMIDPCLEQTDIRHCLIRFWAADGDADGALTEEEVAQCLNLADVQASPNNSLNATARCDPPVAWRMQKHIIGGSDYLADAESTAMFVTSDVTDKPFFLGYLDGPNVISQGNGRRDIFHALKVYVKTEQNDLHQKFNMFDTNSSSSLDSNELHKMLSSLLSGVTEHESAYFAAMADADGDGEITFHEMRTCLSQCTGFAASETFSREVENILQTIHYYVEAAAVSLRDVFATFDFQGSGCLDFRQFALMLAALLPGVDVGDIRRVVRHVQLMDSDDLALISYDDVMKVLGFVGLEFSPEVIRTASQMDPIFRTKNSSKDQTVEWGLVRMEIDGKELLLDENSQLLYRVANSGQPVLCGKLSASGKMEAVKQRDLFQEIESYMNDKRGVLRQLFDEFDLDKNGALETNELGLLLKRIKPSCSQAEMLYFSAMVDVDGDGHITFDEMLLSMRECKRISEASEQGEDDEEAEVALTQLNKHVRDSAKSIKVAFENFDKDNSGFLEFHELGHLLHSLVPSFTHREIRCLLLYFRKTDIDDDGRLSYPELVRALQFSKLTISGDKESATQKSSPMRNKASVKRVKSGRVLRIDMTSEIEGIDDSSERPKANINMPKFMLMEKVLDSVTSLVDPNTANVYFAQKGSLPVLRGRMVAGGLKRDMNPHDVLQPIGNALRERSERLKVLFRKYDMDMSGTLDMLELRSLLCSFMPGLSELEAAFCQVMLDVDGDGSVDETELRAAIDSSSGVYAATESMLQKMPGVLSLISTNIRSGSLNPKTEFDKLDAKSAGRLGLVEACKLLRILAPNLKNAQRKIAHAYLYYSDFDVNGSYTYQELMQCFGFVQVIVEVVDPETRVLGRKKSLDKKRPEAVQQIEVLWKLTQQRIKGDDFWVDRMTNLVYRPVSEGEWPRLHGKLTGTEAVDASYRQKDLFQGLERYMQERKLQMERLFEKFDWDKSGRLDGAELSAFLIELMPAATELECDYFRVMMNIEGSEKGLSYPDFLESLEDCLKAVDAVTTGSQALEVAMRKLKDRIKANHINMAELFHTYDDDGDGEQHLWEANSMIQAIIPSASANEKRILLGQLYAWDVDHNGLLSYPEVMRSLRMATIRLMGAKSSVVSAQQGTKLLSDWRLKLVRVAGQPVLLDRQSGLGFKESRHDGYPVLLGMIRNGEVIPRSADLELFSMLEVFLNERKVRMREAFGKIDWDGSGSIRSADFPLFLRELMPSVTFGDEMYFETMLDAGQNRGAVGYTDLCDTMQECLRISVAVRMSNDQALDNLEFLLINFANHVKDCHINPSEVFDEADADDSGYLDFRELAVLLLQLQPNLQPRQIRSLVAHMRCWDLQDQGKMSFTDFARAFRLTNVQVEQDGKGSGDLQSSQHFSGVRPNLYSGKSFNPGSVPDAQQKMMTSSRSANKIGDRGSRGSLLSSATFSRPISPTSRSRSGLSKSQTLQGPFGDRTGNASPLQAVLASRATSLLSSATFSRPISPTSRSRSGLSKSQPLQGSFGDRTGNAPPLQAVLASRATQEQEQLTSNSTAAPLSMNAFFNECLAVSSPYRRDDHTMSWAAGSFGGTEKSPTHSWAVGPSGGNGRLNMSRDGFDVSMRSSFGGGSPTRWKHSSRVGVASGTSKSGDWGQRQSVNTISGSTRGVRGRGVLDRFRTSISTWKDDEPVLCDEHEVEGMIWQLEEMEVEGDIFLYDKETECLYKPSRRTGYPELVGRVYSAEGGGISDRSNSRRIEKRMNRGDVFQNLQELVTNNRDKVNDAFNHHDYDRSLALDTNELYQLLMSILPRASQADGLYFMVMLGIEKDEQLDFSTLVDIISASAKIGESLRQRKDGMADGIITKIVANVHTRQLNIEEIFQTADYNKTNALDLVQARNAVKMFLPSITDQEMRYVMAHLYYQDFDGLGHMDLHQFVCRLRLAHVFIKHMHEDEVAASAPPRLAGGTFSSPMERPLSMSELRMSALERHPSPTNQGSLSWRSTSGMPNRAPEDLRSSGHAIRCDWELDWRLETVPQNEEFDLLLDTLDGKVFEVTSEHGSYPYPVGILLETGQMIDHRRSRDIFTEFNLLLKERRTGLRGLLDGRTEDGSLTREGVGALVTSLVSDIKAVERQYFECMVDIEETGLITLDEIILMIEECSNIASDVYTGQSQELEEVIQKLGIHILDKGISVFAIVQKLGIASAGMDGTRFIPMKDQAKFLRALDAHLTDRELRLLLSYLVAWDVACTGSLSYLDLMHALRLTKIVVMDLTEGGGHVPSQEFIWMSNFRPQATESADYNTFLSDNRVDREQDMSWDLSTIVSGRLEYLLDQKTTKVYRQGFSGYPQLYGKLRRNAVESLHLNSEESHMLLVMEKQIKERSVHLRELYSQLDVLGKGSIRASDLKGLVKKLLPKAKAHDALYFQVMINIQGEEWLTYQDLKAAMDECVFLIRKHIQQPALVQDVVDHINFAIKSRGRTVRQIFDREDSTRRNRIDYVQLARMLKNAAPGITIQQIRIMVDMCYLNDIEDTGLVTYVQLLQVLQLAHVVVSGDVINLDEGKTEKRTQGLECRPLPHESYSAQAMPKASQELANAFGQSIRLSADFVKREREGSCSQNFSSGNSPMHDEEHGMVVQQQISTKIDPERDALVFAGNIDVGGLSSNLPTMDDNRPSRSPRKQGQSHSPTRLSGRDTLNPPLQPERSATTDLEERFNWQAEDNQTRLNNQGNLARRTMDSANGAAKHINRVMPKGMERRKRLQAAVHNALHGELGGYDKGLTTHMRRAGTNDKVWSKGVTLMPHTYDSFGSTRQTDALDMLEDLSQAGVTARWASTRKADAVRRANSARTTLQRASASRPGGRRSHPSEFVSDGQWQDFMNPPVIFESSKPLDILSQKVERSRQGQRRTLKTETSIVLESEAAADEDFEQELRKASPRPQGHASSASNRPGIRENISEMDSFISSSAAGSSMRPSPRGGLSSEVSFSMTGGASSNRASTIRQSSSMRASDSMSVKTVRKSFILKSSSAATNRYS